MKQADLSAVLGIEQQANTFPWSLKNIRDCLDENQECWVACLSNTDGSESLIAYALVSSVLDESNLLNLCVSLDHQRKGYGKAFLKYLLKHASEKGQACFFLEVRAGNKAAIQLYESLGFIKTGLRKGYYSALKGREDALTYRLNDLTSC